VTTPALSVIMTAYNAEPFVAESVRSIQAQTTRDWELIVVNDASSDLTGALLDDLARQDDRIRVLHRQQSGRSQALNLALAHARADLVANLDADDLATPDRLALQADYLRQHPEVAVVGGAVQYIRERELTPVIDPSIQQPQEVKRWLPRACCITHSTVMMRKQAVLGAGGYRDGYPPSEDYDLWLRLSDGHALANLPQVLVQYRVHGSQLSGARLRPMALSTLLARLAAQARQQGRPEPDVAQSDAAAVLRQAGVDDATIELTVLRLAMARSDLLQRLGLSRASADLMWTATDQVTPTLGRRRILTELDWHHAYCAWRDRRLGTMAWRLTVAALRQPSVLLRLFKR
jgi:glycosyltransferase involved in cell wall biosynthesis